MERGFVTAIACVLLLVRAAAQGRPVPPLPPVGSRVPVSSYQVVHSYPHDPRAYTQGPEDDRGRLFEGTGQNGASWLRKVDLTTGRVLQETQLAKEFFGEGITIWR